MLMFHDVVVLPQRHFILNFTVLRSGHFFARTFEVTRGWDLGFQSVHQSPVSFLPCVLQIAIHIGAHRSLPRGDRIHVAIDFAQVPRGQEGPGRKQSKMGSFIPFLDAFFIRPNHVWNRGIPESLILKAIAT